jgi:hypothetical protein
MTEEQAEPDTVVSMLQERFGVDTEELCFGPDFDAQRMFYARLLTLLVAIETEPELLRRTLGALRTPVGGPVGDAVVQVFRLHMTAGEAQQVGEDLLAQWQSHLGQGRGDPSAHQVGGDHYLGMAITPREYNVANGLSWDEGNVVKYVSRWRAKNGLQDLLKARHYLDMLIADAEAEEASTPA